MRLDGCARQALGECGSPASRRGRRRGSVRGRREPRDTVAAVNRQAAVRVESAHGPGLAIADWLASVADEAAVVAAGHHDVTDGGDLAASDGRGLRAELSLDVAGKLQGPVETVGVFVGRGDDADAATRRCCVEPLVGMCSTWAANGAGVDAVVELVVVDGCRVAGAQLKGRVGFPEVLEAVEAPEVSTRPTAQSSSNRPPRPTACSCRGSPTGTSRQRLASVSRRCRAAPGSTHPGLVDDERRACRQAVGRVKLGGRRVATRRAAWRRCRSHPCLGSRIRRPWPSAQHRTPGGRHSRSSTAAASIRVCQHPPGEVFLKQEWPRAYTDSIKSEDWPT